MMQNKRLLANVPSNTSVALGDALIIEKLYMSLRITTDLDVGDIDKDLGVTTALNGDLWRW